MYLALLALYIKLPPGAVSFMLAERGTPGRRMSTDRSIFAARQVL